jgi:SAM-dependent methyltransferase
MKINEIITTPLESSDGIWFGPEGNYWSNLDKNEQELLAQDLKELGARGALQKHFPQFMEVVFSPKRAAGMALLDIKPDDVVMDAGCMWGALTVPLARTGCSVIGVEQTLRSLSLLRQRLLDEGLDNVDLICADLKKVVLRPGSIDKVVVNGVLEWIPQSNPIELKNYFGKKTADDTDAATENPGEQQRGFLKKIFDTLKDGGVLYLAIENRYDFLNFLGKPDPHCNLRFVTFLPRGLQNLISRLWLGRPYTNWIYSPAQLQDLLRSVGFEAIDTHYAFPDYRFPEYILSVENMGLYKPFRYRQHTNFLKKTVVYFVEEILYKRLKLAGFAPCLIVTAKKG